MILLFDRTVYMYHSSQSIVFFSVRLWSLSS